ncbi:uncharacterized protein LOC143470477 [Clavelina lepadiformis]|uniref:uncharacterized protein LOC143470477 n=1 Tax=Clavelina lepadiformis TaxID=159417 RepID=UPI00404133DA
MNFFCSPPKFELGESFISFLSTFECFCDSVDATAAARKHAFMVSLPEDVKLEMICNGAQLGTMNYEELKSKAEEVACCSLRCNKAKQQLIQRTQALGETNRSYVNALVNLGAIAYPKPEDEDAVKKLLIMEPDHVQQHVSKIQPMEQVPSAYEEMKQMIQDLRQEVDTLRESLSDISRRSRLNHNHPFRESRTCFACGERGHISRYCLQRNRQRGGHRCPPLNPSPQPERELVTYKIHRSGSKHSNADALSRRPQSSRTSDSNGVEVNPERYPFEVEENFETCKTSTESVLSIDLREGFGWTPDQISQAPSKTPRAPLVPSDELEPMQRIEIDVLGGLPVTHSGNRYILVATDMYTKYMQAWSMPSQTAQETAFVLYHNWMTIHGVPERIHSD